MQGWSGCAAVRLECGGLPQLLLLAEVLLLLSLLLLCRAGLDVLLSDLSVVGCHSTTWAAKYHSELGAAAAMFKAGYSIDSLLIR
jgi:hypothetical protein